STANTRNFAPYLSAILRASLYWGELYAALASSRLLYLRTVTRVLGGSPSMDVPGPAARSWLPDVLSAACAIGANSLMYPLRSEIWISAQVYTALACARSASIATAPIATPVIKVKGNRVLSFHDDPPTLICRCPASGRTTTAAAVPCRLMAKPTTKLN